MGVVYMTTVSSTPPPPPTINIIQTNLQHSITSTSTLRRVLEVDQQTIALIQEPWIRKGRVCGLSNIGGRIILDTTVSEPRACIFAPKHVNTRLINEFCSRDLTAVRLSTSPPSEQEVVLASAYLPGDAEVPPPELSALIAYCEKEGLELIVSADANAHHPLWGSAQANRRGEELLNYLISTNLKVLNRGSEPTFVTSRAQTIIDITLATEYISQFITDWHVSDEVSCCDHRRIRYKLQITVKPLMPRRNPRKTDRGKFRSLTGIELRRIEIPQTYHNAVEIDTHVNHLTKSLISCYEQTCPLTTPGDGATKQGSWWTPALTKLRRKVRKLFNRAKNTREEEDWSAYKAALSAYKKRIRLRKTECWRRFCSNIDSNNQAAKVKSILSSEPERSVGSLRKPDGSFTKTDDETCQLLLETHFPGCLISEERTWNELADEPSAEDWTTAHKVVSIAKVRWAINSFLPFKSAGLDNVFPGLLI